MDCLNIDDSKSLNPGVVPKEYSLLSSVTSSATYISRMKMERSEKWDL
jgi:hypothetical protein